MCSECLKGYMTEAGVDEVEWTTEMEDLLDLCEEYYGLDGNGTGGALHIVLDDMNVEDRSILWCAEFYEGVPDRMTVQGVTIPGYTHEGSPEDRELFDKIVEGLLKLSVVERATVVNAINGYRV